MEVARNLKQNSTQCLHNSRSAENEKRSLPGTAQSGKRDANSAPGSFSTRTKDAESVLKTGPGAEKRTSPGPSGPGITKNSSPRNRRPRAMSAGRKAPGMWRNSQQIGGPAQGPAGSPADLPFMFQRGGESGTDGFGPVPGNGGCFPVQPRDGGYREVLGLRDCEGGMD